MRVCPKCHYVDPPEWRHQRWSYWIDFCTYEQFKQLYPAIDIQPKQIVEHEDYLYRRVKNERADVVHRKAKIDYGTQWNVSMEKVLCRRNSKVMDFRRYWQKHNPSDQSRLLEVKK